MVESTKLPWKSSKLHSVLLSQEAAGRRQMRARRAGEPGRTPLPPPRSPAVSPPRLWWQRHAERPARGEATGRAGGDDRGVRGGGGSSSWCQPKRGEWRPAEERADEGDGRVDASGKGGKRRLTLSPATFVSACTATEDEGGWIHASAAPVSSAATAPGGVGTAVTMALTRRTTGERGGGWSARRASVAADRRRVRELFLPLINACREYETRRREENKETMLEHSYVDTLLDTNLPDDGNHVLADDEIIKLCSEFLNTGTDTTSTALQCIMAKMEGGHRDEVEFAEVREQRSLVEKPSFVGRPISTIVPDAIKIGAKNDL
uniref:Cytochrome P450-like protein n=1 Tax=Oryza sativa subsp. japonica TaxID=39947 RepID=Q8GVI9_ORYSJ|nr:cytochrome P450-like protein [Oryza sativa Japonica Group]